MKKSTLVKLMLLVIVILMLATPAFAGRIEDLVKENIRINGVIKQKQQEIIQLTQIRLQNLGGIRELQRVEAEKVAGEEVEIAE